MVIVLGVLVVVFLAALLIGAVTGRVKITSCCAVADPRCDARMRGAFDPVAVPSDTSPAAPGLD